MRTFYSLTKRQFLGMTKFNKFLYGNSKEKKVFAYTFFAISLTAIILFFCWFRMAFQICMTFQYPQEIFKYLLKPFVVVSIFMTFLSALIKGSGILYWGEITYTGPDGVYGRSGAGGISGAGERAAWRVSNRWNPGQWNAGTADGGFLVIPFSAVSDYGKTRSCSAGNFKWKSSASL